MRLAEKCRTALVTGASAGLGASFAQMLVDEGVVVWGTSRDLRRIAPPLHPLQLDLEDTASVEAAWTQAERESGGIDLLVNNAGRGVFGAVADVPLEAWERQFDQVFLSPVKLSLRAFAAMRARGRGGIVNVSSLAVEFPIPFMSGYNAAKAALSAWTTSLSLEARGSGITILDFRPGDYRTDFNQAMASKANPTSASPEEVRVWQVLESNLAAAPLPQRAASDLRRALARGRSGTVRSGGFFQATLAPFLARFGSRRVVMFFLRHYFRLG